MPRWHGHPTGGALSFRWGCLLSEPEAGEGCPPGTQDPLVGGVGDPLVGGEADPLVGGAEDPPW